MATNKETRARFDELDQTDLTNREIADILGVSERTTIRWRAKAGRKRPGRGQTPRPEADRQQAARLIEDGCSIHETARTIGASPSTIDRWFPGTPRLTRAEANAIARLERRVYAA